MRTLTSNMMMMISDDDEESSFSFPHPFTSYGDLFEKSCSLMLTKKDMGSSLNLDSGQTHRTEEGV